MGRAITEPPASSVSVGGLRRRSRPRPREPSAPLLGARANTIAAAACGLGQRPHRPGVDQVKPTEPSEPPDGCPLAVAAIAGVVAVAWAVPSLVIAVSSRALPHFGVVE